MAVEKESWFALGRRWVAAHLSERQHRNAYYLIGNNVLGAATGLLFWLVFARAVGLSAAQVGLGYAIVALGTTIGVVAKGGLDTALLRTVPGASRAEAIRLVRFACLVGAGVALAITLALAYASYAGDLIADVATPGWALVAAIGILLVVTWLQDAHFLAEGDARFSFQRNLVFSAARILLPLPVVLLGLTRPVALTWALALAASALAAMAFQRRIPERAGRDVPRKDFLRSSARNISGGAAEFLPGLILAPLVLAFEDPASAAYFGIAWTAASLLFLACNAISRSALAEMVRNGHHGLGHAIRRGLLLQVILVLPAALVIAGLSPYVLAIFGADYAAQGAPVLTLLCTSVLLVGPFYLYLGVLRARERPTALLVFPALMVGTLLALAPLLLDRMGLPGVAVAWFAANLPVGVYALWRLRTLAREVTLPGPAPHLRGVAHLE